MDIIRLSELEQNLLAAGGLEAETPVAELAELLGCKAHQAHYALKRLSDRGIIRKAWIIDVFKLGLGRFNIFFTVAPLSAHGKQKLLATLTRSPRTVFLAEVGGEFDYELSLIARDAHEAHSFMQFVERKCGDVFYTKSISSRSKLVHYPRKYLSTKPARRASLAIGDRSSPVEADVLDVEILQVLAEQPHASRREVARALGKPQSSIDLRIKRLIEKRVICGAMYSTNAKLYGALSYKLVLYSRGFSAEFGAELENFAAAHPHITAFVSEIGEWDFELISEVEEYAQIIALREEVLRRFGKNINGAKILSRFAVHKYAAFGLPKDEP